MNCEEMTACENSKKCEIDEALSSMSPDDFSSFFFPVKWCGFIMQCWQQKSGCMHELARNRQGVVQDFVDRDAIWGTMLSPAVVSAASDPDRPRRMFRLISRLLS